MRQDLHRAPRLVGESRDVDPHRRGPAEGTALLLHDEDDAVEPAREADAGQVRSPDGLGQVVVAPAPADGVLGPEIAGEHLVGCLGVVVQTAHQPFVQAVGEVQPLQSRPDLLEVVPALRAEVIVDGRGGVRRGPAGGVLAVQDAQGIAFHASQAGLAELASAGLEVGQ